MTKKELLEQLKEVDDDEEIVVLATGAYNKYTGKIVKCDDNELEIELD